MRTKTFFFMLSFIFFAYGLRGQQDKRTISITGTVVDAFMYPVVNAAVVIDGCYSGSLTDSHGRYKVRVRRDAGRIGILTSETGFIEVPINGMTRINFEFNYEVPPQPLAINPKTGDEEVNIGYNSVKKKHVATQATEIDATKAKYSEYSDIYEMIRNEVAGVRVNGTNIVIPESSYFQNPVPPLLFVDGLNVSSLSGIPPSMVGSITILKGASAAIYGPRGYGGVIMILTRVFR